MGQIGFGKHRTAGGDFGDGAGVVPGQRTECGRVFKFQALRLLIEEAARAGRTAAIGAKGAVIALTIQLDQAEFFGTDGQDRPGLRIILPGSGHGGDPIVIAMGHLDGGWGGGCGCNPFDTGQVELAHRPFQVIIDLAVVKTIGGFDTFAGRADLCHGNGGRTDIDA